MARDWFDDYGEPENRKAIVARHLARLVTPDLSDPPEIAERKRQEAAERLRRQDELFGVWPGCTLGAPPPWEVGDPEGDAAVS
jgi:hypothetical protein